MNKYLTFKIIILLFFTMFFLFACQNNEEVTENQAIPSDNSKEEKIEQARKTDKEEGPETKEPETKEGITEEMVMDPSSIYAIVNRAHRLEASYVPNDLVAIEVNYINDMPMVNQLRQEASDALTELFEEAWDKGYSLYAVSGYRSYEYQEDLYNNFIMTHGEEEARRFSAPPGASEHQTGLAMDITSEEVAYGLVDTFGNTDDGIWVNNNAHRFGFIIRYPYGKEEVTGYMYEPWHLRYVGEDLADALYKSGLAYEEYLSENNIEVKN